MPTYEYHCKDCSFEFEEFQSIASEPLQICPKCKGRVERKISGGTGLIFKGSGFYITDYKNKKTTTNEPSPKPKEKDKPKTKAS
jgi:putative FmdB family regulatory protein